MSLRTRVRDPVLWYCALSRATTSESPTFHSCAFRWTSCSTTAELPAFPLALLRRLRSLPFVTASPIATVAAAASPLPAQLERLTPEQRASFLRVRKRLPAHLRAVAFDLHGPGWTALPIEQVGAVICVLADVFSRSKTDFGSCSLMPFEILAQEGSAPVTSQPHRINLISAKEVNATLNQYLAAGQIQHSTSPYWSSLVAITKKS